ncbi:MAG TPA: fibronectin type III domain-containing protein, partial [Catenuloplanes sp.]
MTGRSRRRWRSPGGLVTVATVLTVLTGMGATLFGVGTAKHAVASFDAASWMGSRAKGEIARVNGVTGRVDTRLEVPRTRGHSMQVSQTDRFLMLRDLNTGQVSSLDLATLQITATTGTASGLGVSVALHEDAAFVIDAVQGSVSQLDPRTLTPIGEPIHYPPGITGGVFDGAGRLWIALPGEGTLSAITPAPLPAAGKTGAAAATSPRRVRTVGVAAASHDLTISTLDAGVAVLDRTTGTLTIVDDAGQRAVPLPLAGPGTLPPRTNGGAVPVTVPDSRQVYVVAGGAVRDFTVPGDGARLRPAVAWANRFYCADDETGIVHVFDATGQQTERIDVRGAGGTLELEVRENHLFINAPQSSTARVVDDKHQVRVVDKYANNVLGGDPPPAPPPAPEPPKPKKPQASPPSAPRSVTAAAGNAQVRVSWRPAAPNGAPITRYVVQGAGKTHQVGADQRSLEVTGLTNGETYRFTVHAVNAKGDGPGRTSNPVVPTAEVPDPPASVTAKEKPDGTVTVSWPAANGQGRAIRRYAVTAVSAGASAPIGESTGTELVIKAGELQYGTQYAFSVVAV